MLPAALAIALASTLPTRTAQPQGERPTIAILYFTNSSMVRRADYEPLSKGITSILITELQANPSIRIVERDRIQQLLEEQNLNNTPRIDQETAVKIGSLLGVHYMVMGGFLIDLAGNMRLDARAVRVETSQVVYGETITAKAEDVLTTVAALAEKMNRGLKLPEIPPRPRPEPSKGASNGTKRLQAIMLYSRALAEEDNRNPQGAVQLYREFLQKCPESDAPDQRRLAEQRIRELEARL